MLSTVLLILYSIILLSVSISDFRTMKIPNKIIFPAIILALCMMPFQPGIATALIGAVVGGGFMLIPAVAFGKYGGMGDVKMAIFMGLILGWHEIVFALLIAHLVPSLMLIGVPFGWVKPKQKIPFGPFLSLGTIIMLLVSYFQVL